MKKIIYMITIISLFAIPSFSKVEWDFGVDTNYEDLLLITHTDRKLSEFEIRSEIDVSVEKILDNGMSIGLASVIASDINKGWELDSSYRIVKLFVGYKF